MEDNQIEDIHIVVLDSNGNYFSTIRVGINGYNTFESLAEDNKESEIITDNKTNTNYIIRDYYSPLIATVKEIEINGVKKSVYISNMFIEILDEINFSTEESEDPFILGRNEEAIIYGITYPKSRSSVDGIFINDGPIAEVIRGDRVNENLAIINEDGLAIAAGTSEGYESFLKDMKDLENKATFYFIIKILFYIVVIILIIMFIRYMRN